MSRRLHRLRLQAYLTRTVVNVTALFLVLSKLLHRHLIPLVCFLCFCVVVWWISDSTDLECDGPGLKKSICTEFSNHEVTGDFCYDFCVENKYALHRCYVTGDSNKNFPDAFKKLTFRTAAHSQQQRLNLSLQEGIPLLRYKDMVREVLVKELGDADFTSLIKAIFHHFDVNADNKLNLGEAQNLWRLLHQDFFLAHFIFQGSTAIPQFNGSCGGLSMWFKVGSVPLYQRSSPWPLRLFSNNAYRWTLPKWVYRAKVMMGLLEFVEDMYEKEGVRFHLCNLDGLTLHHMDNYELVVTDSAMLVSARQVENVLANRTCHHNNDCTWTRQCQTSCLYDTGRCSPNLIQPTLMHVCDIMEDYLLFDAPRNIKSQLFRLLQRCRLIPSSPSKQDLIHSVLVADLKVALWKHVQHLKK